VTQNKSIKYTFRANADLVVRMHFDHDYSAEDICLRLRYDIDNVIGIIDMALFINILKTNLNFKFMNV
jgi:hypothetical protein